MSYRQYIPNDKKEAEEVINNLLVTGRQMQAPQAIKWWIAHWYLQGARNFSNLDYKNGSLQISYRDESGKLNFQYEEILAVFQAQVGRLIGLNLAPAVKQKGVSLDGMKKKGIAQIALSTVFTKDKADKLILDLIPPLLKYGMLGLATWVEGPESMGIEVVMPWELIPIPPHTAQDSDVRGLIRVRTVPLDWVQGLSMTPKEGDAVWKELQTISVPTGQLPTEVNKSDGRGVHAGGSSSSISVRFGASSKGSNEEKAYQKTVEFLEVWLWTPDDYLAEYLVFAGGKQLHRKDYTKEDLKVHRPIHIVGDIQTGSFYKRSYVDTLIPINTELEYTISRVFEEAQDWDLFGYLLWPSTSGVPVEANRGADGLKRLVYEIDWTSPQPAEPKQVKPVSPGMFSINALKVGKELMSSIARQPTELLSGDAPGRVDSSSGLGLLYEFSRLPLSPTAKSISIAVCGCYKAMLGVIQLLWTNEKLVNVTMLDDALAGLAYDFTAGTIKLAPNAVPHPDEVEITISSDAPVSREQQKMELQESLNNKIITPLEYRIEVRKRGLDLPVGSDLEWQNYRRAMMENIIMFGDGKKPGQVVLSERDHHFVHLMVIDSFMARPEFYAATAEVRDKLAQHREEHQIAMGGFPEQLGGNPEDLAEQAMMGDEQGMPGMEGLPPLEEMMQGMPQQ